MIVDLRPPPRRAFARDRRLAHSVESDCDGVRGIEGRRWVVVAVPRLEAPDLTRLDGDPAQIELEGDRAGRARTRKRTGSLDRASQTQRSATAAEDGNVAALPGPPDARGPERRHSVDLELDAVADHEVAAARREARA